MGVSSAPVTQKIGLIVVFLCSLLIWSYNGARWPGQSLNFAYLLVPFFPACMLFCSLNSRNVSLALGISWLIFASALLQALWFELDQSAFTFEVWLAIPIVHLILLLPLPSIALLINLRQRRGGSGI
jgi:hypothetical protein